MDESGKFTEEAGEGLVGLDVLTSGNEEILKRLADNGALLLRHKYNHKYPYDWRSKQPVIVR